MTETELNESAPTQTWSAKMSGEGAPHQPAELEQIRRPPGRPRSTKAGALPRRHPAFTSLERRAQRRRVLRILSWKKVVGRFPSMEHPAIQATQVKWAGQPPVAFLDFCESYLYRDRILQVIFAGIQGYLLLQ